MKELIDRLMLVVGGCAAIGAAYAGTLLLGIGPWR